LLGLLSVAGGIVTIDAMGCQREIAAKILEKKANYILALKGNQGTLREDVEKFFQEQKALNFALIKVDQHETVEKDHGRLERRRITVFADVEPLQKRHNWPGLQTLIMVEYGSEGNGTNFSYNYLILISIYAIM
jgi:predicted transposase YbfD/YdcC